MCVAFFLRLFMFDSLCFIIVFFMFLVYIFLCVFMFVYVVRVVFFYRSYLFYHCLFYIVCFIASNKSQDGRSKSVLTSVALLNLCLVVPRSSATFPCVFILMPEYFEFNRVWIQHMLRWLHRCINLSLHRSMRVVNSQLAEARGKGVCWVQYCLAALLTWPSSDSKPNCLITACILKII